MLIFADLNLQSSLKEDYSSQEEDVENNRERVFIYRQIFTALQLTIIPVCLPFLSLFQVLPKGTKSRASLRCINYEIPLTNPAFASRTAVLVGISSLCRELIRMLRTWSPSPFPLPYLPEQSPCRLQSFSSKKAHSDKERSAALALDKYRMVIPGHSGKS